MKECDLRLREFTVQVNKNVLIHQEEFLVQVVLLRRNGTTFANSYDIHTKPKQQY